MNTSTARKIDCHKCNGTGIVDRFLDHDGGVCYDCNGEGRIAYVAGSKSKMVRVTVADIEVGLRIRHTTKSTPETITGFHRHPELPAVTVVTTDAGSEYTLGPVTTSPLVLA